MRIGQDVLDQAVANPSESLNVELKRWIDPASDEGSAKIAIACMALRNRDGGRLIIGFDDLTRQPVTEDRPTNVLKTFNADLISTIVSRYASSAFEVDVGFGRRAEGEFPVISVPPGVTSPVAARRPLKINEKMRIQQDGVYFRTLNSNGKPSSSIAKHSDWQEIVQICFENREADFGRFLRRQLGVRGAQTLAAILREMGHDGQAPIGADTISELAKPSELLARSTLEQRTFALLRLNDVRRKNMFESEQFRERAKLVEDHASWSAMLVFDPPFPETDSSRLFLNTLAGANPQYSGWPIWLDSTAFQEEEYRPRKMDRGWTTVLLSPGTGWGSHADFYRVEAKGEFYLWRVLQDDMSEKVEPGTVLDPGLVVFRVAETIAVGLAFAKALDRTEATILAFGFRWEHLEGRTLRSWTDPMRYFSHYGAAYDDEAVGYVEIDAGTSVHAIAPFVQAATRELFGVWAFEFPISSIEKLVAKMLNRTW